MKKFLSLIIIFTMTCVSVFAENITKTKLPNGQTVIIKEIHTNPVVMIDTWVKTGSIDENDKNNGVAHFLEHLFFKGSKNFPNNEFDKILESKGAVTNAATSKDFTHFHILIPSKDFETALTLHADMLTQPLFPNDEIDKERQVVIREIERSNDNPSRVLYNKFSKTLFMAHPYGREVLGSKNIIATIPREEIFNFYSSHYSPNNMITVIAGDIDSKKVTVLLKEKFAKTSANQKAVKNSYKKAKQPDSQINLSLKDDVNTSSLLIGYRCGLKVADKDSFALDLLAVILGQGKSSRFYKEIKDKKQLAQGVSASNSSMKEDSVFVISASFNEKDFDELKKEIFSEVEKVKDFGVTQEELERAKKIFERDTLYSRESVENTASEIGYSTLISDDWNFYEEYLPKMRKITTKDVQKAAKKYLNSEKTVIAVLSPEKQTPDNNCKIVANQPEDSVKINPSEYFKPKKHSPVNTEKFGNITRYTLKNGAVLLIDKHKNNEIVAINIKIKGGNYLNNTVGLSGITSAVMLNGTEKYPKNSFSEITEENGIKISASGEKEYFSVSEQFIKQDTSLALDLLYQVLNKAALKEEEIEKTKTSMLYSVKQSRNIASNVVFEELNHEFWQNTPYDTTGITAEKTIPSITKQDVEKYYNNLFDSTNTVIAINGDVNEQEMINYFSEILSPKSEQKVNYKDFENLFSEIGQNKTITKEQGKESAWLVISWQTDGLENIKDKTVLRVLNAVLGSGMSSRLFTNVRAQKGLAYAVGSTDTTFFNKGMFNIYIGTEPSKIDEAQNAIMKEIERLKKEFITDKELEDAKNKIKGEIILSQESNMAKASYMSLGEQNGNNCDYYFGKINQDTDEVTVSDVIHTANKYFSKPYIISKVVPKK